ncbi:MAG: hypothetical protein ACPG8W_22935 [Candidatus Promineifilaceae bacterium]
MNDQKLRRFSLSLTQIMLGIALIVGAFIALGLNQNATNYQQVKVSEGTFQSQVYAEYTREIELQATLTYVSSESYVEAYNRAEANKIAAGEVRIIPLTIEATPAPTPTPLPTPDPATYARPWQMWWHLLTDAPAPEYADEPLNSGE